jgi:hypothetical protein
MLRFLNQTTRNNLQNAARRCLSTQKNSLPKRQLNTEPTPSHIHHDATTPKKLPTITSRYGKELTFFELANNYTSKKTNIESSRSFGSSPSSNIDI